MRIRGNLIERDWHYEPPAYCPRVPTPAVLPDVADLSLDSAAAPLEPQCNRGHFVEGRNRRKSGACRACDLLTKRARRRAKADEQRTSITTR